VEISDDAAVGSHLTKEAFRVPETAKLAVADLTGGLLDEHLLCLWMCLRSCLVVVGKAQKVD
jgi:hypothetical protein